MTSSFPEQPTGASLTVLPSPGRSGSAARDRSGVSPRKPQQGSDGPAQPSPGCACPRRWMAVRTAGRGYGPRSPDDRVKAESVYPRSQSKSGQGLQLGCFTPWPLPPGGQGHLRPGAQRGSRLGPCPAAPQPPLLSIPADGTAALGLPLLVRPRPALHPALPRPAWPQPTCSLSQSPHDSEMGMSLPGLPGPLETSGPASRRAGGPARTQGPACLGRFIQAAQLALGQDSPESPRGKEGLSFIFFSVSANSVITK